MQKAPCKDCSDRSEGCHSTCKPYLEWSQYVKDAHKWTNEHKVTITQRSFTGTSPKPGTHRRLKKH